MLAQEDSGPDDVGGVAGVAQDTQKTLKLLNKKGEVVNYNYMSDYTDNAHKCLMAIWLRMLPPHRARSR